jgi:thiol-disulfide isomerase/thioredoxin
MKNKKLTIDKKLLNVLIAAILAVAIISFAYFQIFPPQENTPLDAPATTTIKPQEKPSDKVTLLFFWGDGCPHCTRQKTFMDYLGDKYPQLEVKSYETWKNTANKQIFQDVAKAYGTRAGGVPTTFIGEFEPIIGYGGDERTGKIIEDYVIQCIENGCPNPLDKIQDS